MKQLFEIYENKSMKLIGTDKTKINISEDELEELIFNNPQIICDNIIFIGRQVITSTGKRLDLVALDIDANIIVIELKKGIAPRDVLAQVLDYTSWLNKLSEREIDTIIKSHFEKYDLPFKSIIEAYEKTFKKQLSNRIGNEIIPILFADEFPEDIINSIDYLTNYDVPLRCIEFDYFKNINGNAYLYTTDLIGQNIVDNHSLNNEDVNNEKIIYKKIINNLSFDLNSKYQDWINNLKFNAAHKFRTSQNRPGTWTTSFIEWKFANNILVLEVPLWPKTNDEEKGFCIKLWFRKILEDSSLSEINKIKNELLSKFNFIDGGEINQFIIEKDYLGNIEYDYIKNTSFEIIDILKPNIENIMKLF